MNPRQKAEEIWNLFDGVIYTDQEHFKQVRSCCMILIDQILNYNIELTEQEVKHWQKVRIECENIYKEVKI